MNLGLFILKQGMNFKVLAACFCIFMRNLTSNLYTFLGHPVEHDSKTEYEF